MATTQPPSVDELEKKEEEEFRTGPLSVLTTSVKTNSQARQQLAGGHTRWRAATSQYSPAHALILLDVAACRC